MAYLVEIPIDGVDGSPQIVKAQIEQAADGLVKVARPGQVVARATRSLADMLGSIRPVAEDFVRGFSNMAQAPDEIGVQFGLSLSAEADVVISSTAAQANFQVTLTWRHTPSDPPPVTAAEVDEPADSAQ